MLQRSKYRRTQAGEKEKGEAYRDAVTAKRTPAEAGANKEEEEP